jgi:hypothetical protein
MASIAAQMSDFKIEARARGAEGPSVIITDSEGVAKLYYRFLVASGKWQSVRFWNGSIKQQEWSDNSGR